MRRTPPASGGAAVAVFAPAVAGDDGGPAGGSAPGRAGVGASTGAGAVIRLVANLHFGFA